MASGGGESGAEERSCGSAARAGSSREKSIRAARDGTARETAKGRLGAEALESEGPGREAFLRRRQMEQGCFPSNVFCTAALQSPVRLYLTAIRIHAAVCSSAEAAPSEESIDRISSRRIGRCPIWRSYQFRVFGANAPSSCEISEAVRLSKPAHCRLILPCASSQKAVGSPSTPYASKIRRSGSSRIG